MCFARSLGLGGRSRQQRAAPTQYKVSVQLMLFGGIQAKRLRHRLFFCFALRLGLGGSSRQQRAAPTQYRVLVQLMLFGGTKAKALAVPPIFLLCSASWFRWQFPAIARRTLSVPVCWHTCKNKRSNKACSDQILGHLGKKANVKRRLAPSRIVSLVEPNPAFCLTPGILAK